MLLGEYLRNADLGDFQTRAGMRDVGEHNQSHAWLEQGGLIVDITADQFPEVEDVVIVTYDSDWHQEWRGHMGVRAASLAYYDNDDFRDQIRGIYDQLSAVAQGDAIPDR